MPRMNHASGLLYVRFKVQCYAITKLNVSNDEYLIVLCFGREHQVLKQNR